MAKLRVFIIEDEMIFAFHLQTALKEAGYEVVGRCATGERALTMSRNLSFDLIITDHKLLGSLNGIETVEALREAKKEQIPVIFVTGESNEVILQQMKVGQPAQVIKKPVKMSEMLKCITTMVIDKAAD